MSERALFAEFYAGLTVRVIAGDDESSPNEYYVDNVGENEPDLWYHDAGGSGSSVELSRFSGCWRKDFDRAEVWWSKPTTVYTNRPLVDWFLWKLLPALGVPRKALWRLGLPHWLKYGRATWFSLWRLGYRRRRSLPDWMPEDNPFREMCEGGVVWCETCRQHFPTEAGYDYCALPSHRYDERSRTWRELGERQLVSDAARWQASQLLSSWATDCDMDCEPVLRTAREFDERLEDEARKAADRDAAPEPAGTWRIRDALLGQARQRFPAALIDAAKELAADLEDRAGLETLEHVCPHVWWGEGGVGWTGPGCVE